jgi:single-stranded-DNA-specific exonuclease
MATGRGKSLIFHLHAARTALREGGASVFVFPLRALVADQAFHLEEAMARVGVGVCTLTGESSPTARDEAFAALRDGEVDIVLTTPEFLAFHAARFAAAGRVRFAVVDEAHHVGTARAGHRPAYTRLGEAFAVLGDPSVLAVTATAGDATADAIVSSLGITSVVTDPTVRENLVVEDRRGLADKDAYLASLAARGEKMIVYVNSREQSVRLARMLRKKAPTIAMRVAFYNGGLTRSARQRGGACVPGRGGDRRGRHERVRRGREYPRHPPRRSLSPSLQRHRVQPDVRTLGSRRGARPHPPALWPARWQGQRDGPRERCARPRRPGCALSRAEGVAADSEDGFEITNAELAERVAARRRGTSMNERGVSAGLGVFRELGLVEGEGHGAYRRLRVVPSAGKVELGSSVRYAEGLEEIAEFEEFREWVLGAAPDDLLARFNRPILPSRH